MSTQFPETFDPATQKGNVWDVLPLSEYVAQAVEAIIQQPKSGDGYYLGLTWKVIEGDYEGRQVWQRITYLHSSEQAQTIGRKTLKDLCVATDVAEQVDDAEVFLFKPLRIRLGIVAGQARRLPGQEQNIAHFAVGGEVGRAGTAGQTGSRD